MTMKKRNKWLKIARYAFPAMAFAVFFLSALFIVALYWKYPSITIRQIFVDNPIPFVINTISAAVLAVNAIFFND